MNKKVYDLVLTGRRTGQTVVLNRCQFVDGVCRIGLLDDEIQAFLTYMGRMYQAYPEGSALLAERQKRDAEHGILHHVQNDPAQADGAPASIPGAQLQPAGQVHAEGALQRDGHADNSAGGAGVHPDRGGHADAGLRQGVDAGSDEQPDALIDRVKLAISKLDYQNDEQWTPEGLPAVAYLAEAVGNQKVTRALITEAAPGFNRRKAEDLASL